mmetsp:Transcript_88231/g.184368  ORF Transcript_88231/g.184368 Transcript_88231/m.184368 type:complete len:508 (+) Transcript_88231:103-1626(+)
MAQVQAAADRNRSRGCPACEETIHKHLLVGLKIGQGRFSSVHEAFNLRLDGNGCVVKVVSLQSDPADGRMAALSHESKRRSILAEIEVMRRLSPNRHIAKFVEASIEGCIAYIVMEKCEKTLQTVLVNMPSLTEGTLKGLLRGMLRGITAVHQAGFMHCDIRPANFLCSGETETVVLCDFGDADDIDSRIRRPEDTQQEATAFTAPEVLRCEGCDEKIDVWSFGVCAYAFLFGSLPYMAESFSPMAIPESIARGRSLPSFRPPAELRRRNEPPPSSKAVELVRDLLERDPDFRPTAAEALESRFFLSSNVDPDLSSRSLKPALQLATSLGVFGNGLGIIEGYHAPHPEVDLRMTAYQQRHHGPEAQIREKLKELRSGSKEARTSLMSRWSTASGATARVVNGSPTNPEGSNDRHRPSSRQQQGIEAPAEELSPSQSSSSSSSGSSFDASGELDLDLEQLAQTPSPGDAEDNEAEDHTDEEEDDFKDEFVVDGENHPMRRGGSTGQVA